jgi:eukaryotic-like serine/threonine-protein kinase
VTPGTRLGSFEVLSRIGAGGMGEVWRARDTRLDRTVAIKVLPSAATPTVEQRQRFEREARAISKLSHPHVCALYDVGREGDTEYLVMEYLEGESLADRLARGPLPLEQTLRCGAEIADALDKAHRLGIVHRDLKPGNVMLTKSGVKLLDFGLARVIAPAGAASDLTSNPTAVAPSDLTQEGTLLGTLAYMAPEQLEGRDADGRSDVFALGATLYEMATGRKAFSGSSRASLISSILRDDPRPVSEIQTLLPRALDRVIGRCLAKDPEQRWQSAADVGLELAWIDRSGGPEEGTRAPRASRSLWPIGLAAAAGILAAALASLLWLRRPPPAPAPPIRFFVGAPQGTRFVWIQMQNLFAVSPDGTRIVFVARNADGRDALFVRSLSQLSAAVLGGSEGAAAPFWSPDGRSIAFFADRKLKRIDAAGGSPVILCDAPPGYPSGTWGSQHTILFSALTDTAFHLVSEGGGSPRPTVRADLARREVGVAFPRFLPDGRHFLYVARSESETQAYLRMGSVDDSTSSALISNCSRAEFAPGPAGGPGYLLFARDGGLFAQRFETSAGLSGNPAPLGLDVWQHVLIGSAPVSVSNGGVLATRGPEGLSRLVWFDREGRETESIESPAGFGNVRLSPDGRQVAVARVNPQTGLNDILVGDLARKVLTRLNLGGNDNAPPVWSPDGARLAFSVGSMSHPPAPYWFSLRSQAPPEPIIAPTGQVLRVEDWSSDGRYLLAGGFSGTSIGQGVIDLDGGRTFRLLVPGNLGLAEAQARFSPDGRWLAFCLIESGRSEVYLTSFPGPGERIRVSTAGGMSPRWRRDGRELFYVSADGQMTAIPVRLGADAPLGKAQSLFRIDPAGWRDYDVTADGTRFLAAVNLPAPDADAISVTVNWPSLWRP